MTIIFDDELKVNAIDTLTNNLDLLARGLGKHETIDVYFSTNGGENALMYPVLNTFRKYSDKIVIYLTYEMNSCGMLMLWYLRDYNIYMLPSFQCGLIHCIAFDSWTNSPLKDTLELEVTQENALWASRFKKLGLDNKSLDKFYNKEDVYLSRKQILALFPNIEEIEF